MLENTIRILNVDGSVIGQKRLLSDYDAEVIDLTDLGPRARFWANDAVQGEIAQRVPDADRGRVTFLGSGDFHHLTEILVSRYAEPISVIHFDFHQDWDGTVPLLHCGSWVTRALAMKHIAKVVTIGASAKRMEFFSLQAGSLHNLKDDRLELYPYTSKPGAVFFRRVPENISFRAKRYPFVTRIDWRELRREDIGAFFSRLAGRLPTKKVYITVDKDCMNASSALTNWDQGEMTVEHLLAALKAIKERCDIVGMDITGDYSPVLIDGALRQMLLRFAHPPKIEASRFSAPEITALNEKTNLKILELMTA